MKKTYEEVIGVEAMVDKVLTKDDVIICMVSTPKTESITTRPSNTRQSPGS